MTGNKEAHPEWDYLVIVDRDSVNIGDTYDPGTGIFYSGETGERVFPSKQLSETVEELKTEVAELKETIAVLKSDVASANSRMAELTVQKAEKL
ncbi:MAG: hypothetical protein J1F09_01725 [Oscillospiraceae bacterium]|nr:hypothetical protein [Oscillospiraceae bacterium]